MMRLLFVAPNLHVGGIERQWSALISELAAERHEVSLVTIDGRGRFFEDLRAVGINAECLALRSRADFWRIRRIFQFSPPPDLVISRGMSGLILGALAARWYRAPHVFTEHSGPDSSGTMKPLRLDQRVLLSVVGPRVDRVIAVSTAQLGALTQRRFPLERIVVIPNGVQSEFPENAASRTDMRARLCLTEDAFVALFVGTLRPEKRVDVFVDAIRRMHRIEPRVCGLIAGGGPGYEALIATAAATKEVLPLGERNDIRSLLAAADVLCVTSDIEAMPMSILEAMAAGRAVVATDVGGIPDIVTHGDTGLIVPPGDSEAIADALAALMDDPDRRRRMGNNGRLRQLDNYTASQMVARYVHEFRRAIANTDGNAPFSYRPLLRGR